MRYILVTSVMLRDAYLQRVIKINGKIIPVITYNMAYAKTFHSSSSAIRLSNAIYWQTFRNFNVSVKI